MDRQLKKNIASLTALQAGNYLVPLLILPHLTRVLGVSGFGQFGFATAFIAYFILLVDWGFNLSATRNIAIKRQDLTARSLIFWETMFARIILTGISIFVLWILVEITPKLYVVSTLLWLGILQIIGATLSTAFYYQGIEQMGKMALINLSMRAISIPLIIFLVTQPDQILTAFAIQAGCFLLASSTNFLFLIKSGEIVPVLPKYAGIKQSLIESFPLFLSSAGTSLYTNSNIVILGFVSTQVAVGYFAAAFTLVKAVVGLSGPVGQALFPRISYYLNADGFSASAFLKKSLLLQALMGAVLSLTLLLCLPRAITWFYGPSFQSAIEVVGWLSPLPLIICIASAIGQQTLVPLGKAKWFSSVLLFSGILNCGLLLPLGYQWGANGAAIAVLITECIILFGMALGLKRLEPRIWKLMVPFS